MWREIKRVMQLNLEVRASALQESPDIVILAGHSRLPAPELEKKIALTLFLGICPQNRRASWIHLHLDPSSFDLPAVRA